MGKNVSFRAGMGYGWRTNYNQRVYVWDKDTDVYIWEDEDGTDHYFEKQSDGTFKDEDGLELTLTDTGSGTEKYIIENKNGNKAFFDTLGRLTKISNNQETVSSITVSYTSADSLLISTVTDGVGRVYHYTYNTDNLLTCLSYRGTGMTDLFAVTYAYTDGMLTALTEPGGEMVSYSYNTDYHYLTSATDIDGYKITYEYTRFAEGSPSRISKVQEFDGTASGGVLTIAYGMNETTFTDKLGNVQILQFNNWGNTKSIQDGEGRAQFAQYATDKSDTGKGNQLTLSSKLQNTVVNLLDNSSFEDASCAWFEENEETSFTLSTTQAYLGSQSLTIPSGEGATRVCLSLEAGETYTLSVYVKGDSSVQLEVQHQDGILITGESIPVTNEWTRVQLSCTNPNSTALQVVPVIRNTGTGTIYADCVQLEKAPTASRYNLIQNGDFQTSGQWTATNSATGDGRTTVTASAPKLDSNVYAIIGNPSKQKNIYQTVSVSGSAGDSFVLGGWAKGDAVPIKENRAYGLYAIFNYTDGNSSEAMMAAFNPDTNGWQYTATAIVAEKDYSSIVVYACYDRGANTVYFDGIQLFKEMFGTTYEYDTNGNLTQIVDESGQATTYTYSGENVAAISNSSGDNLSFEYDEFNNLLRENSEDDLITTYTYDTYGNQLSVTITNPGSNKSLTTSSTYSEDGNYMTSSTDELGNVTTYFYNTQTGILEWVQYPEDTDGGNQTNDTRLHYTYDDMHRMINASATTNAGLALSVDYSYTNDLLTSVQTPSTTYNFTYGNFALANSIKVGSQTLVSYQYDDYNRLETLDYGNGGSVVYTYDNQSNVIQETYEDGATISYLYDNDGFLAKVIDSATGITTTYYYNFSGQLMKYTEVGNGYSHSVSYLYNESGNLVTQIETVNGVTQTYTYTYDDKSRVSIVTVGDTTVTYTYDSFDRTTQQVTKHGDTTVLTKNAEFKEPTATTTSSQIASYNGFTYTYDKNGNITSVSDGTNTTTYVYDTANQLIRENNQELGKSWVWTYDSAGNILSRSEYTYTTGDFSADNIPTTVTYSYGNENWGDLLTAYNGATITYDSNGNPLSDGTWSYTWKHGRQLASMSDGTITWNYTYNSNGMRTKRTDGTNTYTYVYNSSQLTAMTKGEDSLFFTYDSNGIPLTVAYNGVTYYYSTNVQGDVVAILDNTGAAVVTYSYDAWGNPGTVSGSFAATLGTINPLRYRGYVYDTETGLYYLQSRYYHPVWERFINADDVLFLGASGTVLGYNLFGYCENNPIVNSDPSGFYSVYSEASWLIDALFGSIMALKLSGMALAAKVSAMILAIAPYLIWIVAAVAAVVLIHFAAKTAIIHKAHSKIKKLVKRNSKTRYWTATLRGDYVDIGRPLTYSQAVKEVASGRNVFAVTWYEAKAVALAAGGNTGYNNKNLSPEVHNNGKIGYYWHYHTYNRKGGHVYYLF